MSSGVDGRVPLLESVAEVTMAALPVPASDGSHGPYTPSSHAGPIYADAVAVDINLEADDEPQMTLRPQTGFPFFVFPG